MKLTILKLAITLTVLLLGFAMFTSDPAGAQTLPTPTYDPFGEPPLPPNPTQFETGRHLYWRHCMPCHGDVGQGLTEDFRILWEDHQGCWDNGCHGGRGKDEGFPIPKLVPALAGAGLVTNYNPDSLFEYLRATHPPQDPGLLSDEDYRALVVFLYHMNGVTDLPSPTPAWTSTPPPSFTPTPERVPLTEPESPLGLWPVIGLAVIATVLVLLRQLREEK